MKLRAFRGPVNGFHGVPGGQGLGDQNCAASKRRMVPSKVSTLSDTGPDGLYEFQSNFFGTNGQNLLLLTRNNELNPKA